MHLKINRFNRILHAPLQHILLQRCLVFVEQIIKKQLSRYLRGNCLFWYVLLILPATANIPSSIKLIQHGAVKE